MESFSESEFIPIYVTTGFSCRFQVRGLPCPNFTDLVLFKTKQSTLDPLPSCLREHLMLLYLTT